jgi:hypothetical protein
MTLVEGTGQHVHASDITASYLLQPVLAWPSRALLSQAPEPNIISTAPLSPGITESAVVRFGSRLVAAGMLASLTRDVRAGAALAHTPIRLLRGLRSDPVATSEAVLADDGPGRAKFLTRTYALRSNSSLWIKMIKPKQLRFVSRYLFDTIYNNY